ncbi:hypothetical protein RJ55_03513 [Drechmeria coniospora]|nr:hypothetical protein RJ55_03513 [Drechmeria coniospora]
MRHASYPCLLAAGLARLLLVSTASATTSGLPAGLLKLGVPNRILPPDDDFVVSVDGDGHDLVKRANASKIVVHTGYFQQLIDHKNPSLGTFTQRYWWNADHYAGPGSPVVMNAPGENNGDGYQGYTTNRTLPGLFAQASGGAALLLEHRYWGGSSPFTNLTAKTLQYLNLENSIADLVYFAKNVDLAFDPTGSSRPDKAPWVLSGCSYPGALAAWTNVLAPGTFWAYHCSSAVVEVISTFSEYYDPIEAAMPRNCSADFRKVIAHVDRVLRDGPTEKRQRLKNLFGFGNLTHDDDFASSLIGGLVGWQGTQFYTGYTGLHRMCDYVENKWPGSKSSTPGEEGVGLCKAVKGFAKWSRDVMIPGSCATYGYWKDNNTVACYDSYDKLSPTFTDTSVNNTVNRQWMWFLCNEPSPIPVAVAVHDKGQQRRRFEYWQVWGPESTSGLVSSFYVRDYWRRQCALYFPKVDGYTYGLARGRSVGQINDLTGGWDHVDTTRLMWVGGEYDPWRPATVSADKRPGGPLASTNEAPVWVIPKAAHCNDLIVRNGDANPVVAKIIREEVAKMKEWVAEFYTRNGPKKQRRALEFTS